MSETDKAQASKAVHAVAQTLCHQRHGDWRYDPGSDKFDGFYEDALELLAAALPDLPAYLAEVEARDNHSEEARA